MRKIFCQQTHSANVVAININESRNLIPNCDGLVTSLKNVSLNIKTADCIPISIRDKNKIVVGIIHAGWRGTKKEISIKAVKLITKKFKISPSDLIIKLGASIDKDSFLVRNDVYELFKNKYQEFFEKVSDSQWKMDLKGINVHQLVSVGVLLENIKVSQISTFKNKKYPSFRRDGRSKGFVTSVVLK